MDMARYRLQASSTIAAPPEDVWDAIADITRMGEFSPVCTGGEWDEGVDGAREGAWFTGHNSTPERTWSTRCLVDAAERGKVFAFVNHGSDGRIPLARWQYELSPSPQGTTVTETWQVLEGYERLLTERAPGVDVTAFLEETRDRTGPGMEATLAALKRACEA